MQVSRRTGGLEVIKGADRVSSTVWIRERQLGGRTCEVVLIKGAVRRYR